MRAGIAPAPSALEQTIDNRINAPLVALARLLGAQAARESLKAGADVAVAESSGGVDA